MQTTSRLFEVEVFVAVVDSGSFSAAGEHLGISSSYASKLVTRLEGRLGARLLQRTTRRLSLTAAGEALYDSCAEALATVAAAEEAVSEEQCTLRGRLRVTLPTALGLSWLTRHIVQFSQQHPALTVDLVYLDRAVDLIAEGFDVAIRAGALPSSSLTARRLGRASRVLVASPDYLAAHGTPATPADLRDHRCLCYSNNRNPLVWRVWKDDVAEQVTVSGPMLTNSGTALAIAAVQGLGVAYLPTFHVSDQRHDGTLVRVLPEWGAEVPISLLYPSRRHLPRKVRAFGDAMAGCLTACEALIR